MFHAIVKYLYLFFLSFFCILHCQAENSLNDLINPYFQRFKKRTSSLSQNKLVIEGCKIDNTNKNISISLSRSYTFCHFTPEIIKDTKDSLYSLLPDSLKEYSISLFSDNHPVEYFIPNYYLKNKQVDKERIGAEYTGKPLTSNQSLPYKPTKGLINKHIALWSSHGRYFNPNENRWEWQRPRLYGISEDTYTASMVLPFLLPMLENAGANVLLPKERDIQHHEVIVDNDYSSDDLSYFSYRNSSKCNWQKDSLGYKAIRTIISNNTNPFKEGSHLSIKTRKNDTAQVVWAPFIPETGYYAVYVSYHTTENSCQEAIYTVHHSGGKTDFKVNQTMGGGTWVYLGTFHFLKGLNTGIGKVTLSNKGKNGIITADAVKFGGGMGCIGRPAGKDSSGIVYAPSKLPKYLEGARYWLQMAGYHDSIFSTNKGLNEYNDDFMSRALWVNNLIGGSMRSANTIGKNIPLDLALALHSDAGYNKNDTYIGSLGIYMTKNYSKYAANQDRIASRDLSDLILTQVINDIHASFDSIWPRRKLCDESYHEARVPEVPTMLFEMLSHQNFKDMTIALDPKFRFVFSRAIYKGIIKYLSSQYDEQLQIQPLPVNNFSIEFLNEEENQVLLSWKNQEDPLEPTANAKKYILYTAIGNNGFDNGDLIEDNNVIINIEPGKIYRFKVTAVNDGGESFPSEILSVGKAINEKERVLIVNGFTRVCGPTWFSNENFQGFLYDLDPGVPYIKDFSFTGKQYDFLRKSEYKSNEHPGIGASYSNSEGSISIGNTFDFPYIHGVSLLHNGCSFVSSSKEAFENGSINTKDFSFIDLILGKQKTTIIGKDTLYEVFSDKMIDVLTNYLNNHGNLFVCGEYIASDAFTEDDCDQHKIDFLEKKLHFTWGESSVRATGKVTSKLSMNIKFKDSYLYHSTRNNQSYYLNYPDVLIPLNNAKLILRHENTNDAAAIIYNGRNYKIWASSIPFETISSQESRDELMGIIVSFFERQRKKEIKMITLPAKSQLNTKSYQSTQKSHKQNTKIKDE